MTRETDRPCRVLLLGGTTEASALAALLATDSRIEATLSLAGRTRNPAAAPIATRVGGFGGASGLADYLKVHAIDVVLDATHPFAATISANAIAACGQTGCSLIALERPAWTRDAGDQWIDCATAADAVAALPDTPVIVFSGLGRLSLDELQKKPQHRYVIRVIDPPTLPLNLPNVALVEGRGPFRVDDDLALFRKHRIDIVLAKNAGGDAAISKIIAARRLGLKVMMIERPHIPPRATVATIEGALQALTHPALTQHSVVHHVAPSEKRGV